MILIGLGLFNSLGTLEYLKTLIILVLYGIGFPILFLGNYYEFIGLYLLSLGYLLLFFSFSTLLFGLKVKFKSYWRYSSFLFSQIFGFILFFLNITIYDRPQSFESNIFFDLPVIMSIVLITTGTLILILGLKEEWDEIWKYLSINVSEIVGIVIVILGFIIYENSNSKLALFSSPSSPNIYIATFLIISGIFVNIAISGILAINSETKLRDLTLGFFLLTIVGSCISSIIGTTRFVLDYVSIDIFNPLYSSTASIYLLISLIFSGGSILFLALIKEERFLVELQVKPLNDDDPVEKISGITLEELESLNSVDIYAVLDLANEEDLEGISKITKINIKRIKGLRDMAKASLLKKQEE